MSRATCMHWRIALLTRHTYISPRVQSLKYFRLVAECASWCVSRGESKRDDWATMCSGKWKACTGCAQCSEEGPPGNVHLFG